MEPTQEKETNKVDQAESKVGGQTTKRLSAIAVDSVLKLEDYAKFMDLTEQAVWLMVRSGNLYSRYRDDQLYVSESPIAELPVPVAKPSEAMKLKNTDLESQFDQKLEHFETSQRLVKELVIRNTEQPSDEIALLIDHLSLSKEENREVLNLAKQSIAQMTEMTEKVVAMKDTLIASKQKQIELLEEKLNLESEKINKLKQNIEDMEMLTRTLAGEQS